MLIDINHFIEKDKKLPKHFISKELFNYTIPKPPKLKDLETGLEMIEAYKFYKRNLGIKDDFILKAIVSACAKYKPTKKDLERQIRKMKKQKSIKKKLRDFEFV